MNALLKQHLHGLGFLTIVIEVIDLLLDGPEQFLPVIPEFLTGVLFGEVGQVSGVDEDGRLQIEKVELLDNLIDCEGSLNSQIVLHVRVSPLSVL